MKNTLIAALLLLSLAAFVTCKKNELGGKSTIKGVVAHHNKKIPYATVFIKFNAKDSPGADTTVYDSKVRADQDGNYSFKCYKGDYYLYGYGHDFSVDSPWVVKGGVPAHIRNKEDLSVDVAVTED